MIKLHNFSIKKVEIGLIKILLIFIFMSHSWNRTLLGMGHSWTTERAEFEPLHEISNNAVCATDKASDKPAHMRSLIRAFACHLNILWLLI